MGRYLDIAKQVCPEVSKESMFRQIVTLNRWIASQWENIPLEARELILSRLDSIDTAIDQACREKSANAFQTALSQKRALVEEHTPAGRTLRMVFEVFPDAEIVGVESE